MTHEESLERWRKMAKLAKLGISKAEIGRRLNVSRQRVFQVLERGKPKPPRGISPGQEHMIKWGISGRDVTREFVRIRDKFTCQKCGDQRTREQAQSLSKKIHDVHHLNGLCGKKSRKYDSVKNLDGLVTLCHKCHFNQPEHRCKSEAWKKKRGRRRLSETQ